MKKLLIVLLLLSLLCAPAFAERRIVEYTVVWVSTSLPMTTTRMSKEVNSMIEKGWLPLGGIAAVAKDALYQAMVRYEEAAE